MSGRVHVPAVDSPLLLCPVFTGHRASLAGPGLEAKVPGVFPRPRVSPPSCSPFRSPGLS